jgi:2,3-bisphosphoglycerate-independent phosphoglycerate mutase
LKILKVATYDLQPLSAFELTEALVPELEKEEVDFVCLNFATAWWAIQEL